jgi:hypothetical protein
MKFIFVALSKKPRQFSKFGSIAEIPIADFPFYQLSCVLWAIIPWHEIKRRLAVFFIF